MAKNCIIYEKLDDVKKMKVTRNDEGLMTLSGTFGVCGVRNNNHRVYETSNYARMVDEMKQRIAEDGSIPGELEHPQMMNITLENISHKITDINIDENGLVTGTIALLDTPKGKLAQAIVEGGLPLFISSRATGQVDPKSGNVTLERIATYDLVGSPGFSQAKLHLNENQMLESINESQVSYIIEKEENIEEPKNIEENIENNTEDMELNEILEKLENLESKVAELEEANEDLQSQIDEQQDFDLEKLANGIQNWIVEEYSPVLQQWITEEFATEHSEEVVEEAKEAAKEMFINEMAPKVQNWIVEEFAPEVEGWAINEFAPGIQNWITEEFAPEAENWLNESYSIKLKESITNSINESAESNKENKLNAIDSVLKVLEGVEATKPTYNSKTIITENVNEPKYIAEMPAEARVKWDMASDEVKESINRRAKIYNFVNEDSIERFWNTTNWDNIKPVETIYQGLDNIVDENERAIRAQLRSWAKRR